MNEQEDYDFVQVLIMVIYTPRCRCELGIVLSVQSYNTHYQSMIN